MIVTKMRQSLQSVGWIGTTQIGHDSQMLHVCNILQYIYLHLPQEFHEMDLKCRVFHTWLPCGTGPCRTTRLVPMLRLLVFFFRLGL